MEELRFKVFWKKEIIFASLAEAKQDEGTKKWNYFSDYFDDEQDIDD